MKAAAKIKSTDIHQQIAALPWRLGETIEILLITSRETKRWVLPKGWLMEGRGPHAAAAQEALEEAGILGDVQPISFGSYRYRKRIKNGSYMNCEVAVFPMKVCEERKRWREKNQRVRKWFPIREAIELVHEQELKDLLTDFSHRDLTRIA